MRRVRIILAVAAAMLCLGAAPRPDCERQLGPLWGPPICAQEGLAVAWTAMNLREPPALAEERRRFDAHIAACTRSRDDRKAEDRRAAFACVRDRIWARTRALAARGDPETMTGRWLMDAREAKGELRILAISTNAVRVELRTISRARGHICALTLDDAWTSEAEVAWKGQITPAYPQSECDVSIRRVGEGTIRLDSTSRCAWICGAAGEYRGVYRLQP